MEDKDITIAMDVDDVCARLSEEWVAQYNKDYNDDLTVDEITEWSIHSFVKPECGFKIYEYLADPHLYDDVVPFAGAAEGVHELRKMGYHVIFTTSCRIEAAGRKFYWLKDNGFSPNEKDYMEVREKRYLKMNLMLDDRYDNVNEFSGTGVLFTRPWNTKYAWPYRANNWNEALTIFSRRLKLWS